MNQDNWKEVNSIFKKAGEELGKKAAEKRKREEETLMYSDVIGGDDERNIATDGN